MASIDLIDGRLVRAALVHRDLFGNTAGFHGLVKELQGCGLARLGRQQEIDRFAFLVYCAVEVFPRAFDLDVCLIHAPAGAHRALVLAKDFLQHGQKPDPQAVDRGMVDTHAAFLHHFLQMSVAERIGCTLPDAHQNDVDWESHSFGSQHHV